MAIKIVLAEDHPLMREGLKSLLDKEFDFKVIGQASDGRETVELTETLKPDLVIMDISMPILNGMEACMRIKEVHAQVKVIALSIHSDEQFVAGMFNAGASGYLLKEAALDELVRAIRIVSRGEVYVSPRIARGVVQGFTEHVKQDDQTIFDTLTQREREVLQLIAESKSTREIAADLFVSEKTVATHRQNIMNKLDMYNIPDLVKYALREGIVSL